jgi:hypothetical protein
VEEEKEWFPKVRAVMGRKALAGIGGIVAAAKADAPPADPIKLLSALA